VNADLPQNALPNEPSFEEDYGSTDDGLKTCRKHDFTDYTFIFNLSPDEWQIHSRTGN
jgi:hypothetical protein